MPNSEASNNGMRALAHELLFAPPGKRHTCFFQGVQISPHAIHRSITPKPGLCSDEVHARLRDVSLHTKDTHTEPRIRWQQQHSNKSCEEGREGELNAAGQNPTKMSSTMLGNKAARQKTATMQEPAAETGAAAATAQEQGGQRMPFSHDTEGQKKGYVGVGWCATGR